MRLRIGISLLFAASLATAQGPQPNHPGGNGNETSAPADGGGGTSKSVVKWIKESEWSYTGNFPTRQVPVVANDSQYYTFTFTINNDLQVKFMRLYRNRLSMVPNLIRGEQVGEASGGILDPGANSGSSHSTSPQSMSGINHNFDDGVPRAKPSTMAPSPRKEASEDLAVRQNNAQPFSFVMNAVTSTGTATVDFNNRFFTYTQKYYLFFEVEWDNKAKGQIGGRSYSRWFAVAGRDTIESQTLEGNIVTWTKNNPSKEAFVDELPPSNTFGGPSVTPGAGPTPTGGSNVDPAINNGGTNAGAASQPESGLSKNAIIGIAVGCGVAGLLLVGALAWFLIRRGHKQRATSTPYGSDRHRRTAELIAEKEATAGVNDSPHSPYSDDGHHGHADAPPPHRRGLSSTAAAGGDGAAGVLLHSSLPDERSYTPYTDQAMPVPSRSGPGAASMPPNSSRSPSRAAGGARSATPEGRYAHLMSPDMTPEERARIEEEERALDRAIEEAGRASRP